MENVMEFQKVLRKAMGGRSQAEFARNCDISAVQINRFMNNPDAAGRPSIPTLIKIAKNASNGVTYADLIKVCGYSDAELDFYQEESEHAKGSQKDRILLTEDDRIKACEEDMLKGFSSFTDAGEWKSLSEFVDYVFMLWAVEDICYDISSENINPTTEKGKYYSRLTLSWVSGEAVSEVYHTIPGAVFFYKTEDGTYIVTKTTFSVKTLIDLKVIDADLMPEDMYNKNIITVSKSRTYAKGLGVNKSLGKEVFKYFMDGMINPKTQRWYPKLVSGYGFDITNGMPNIVKFLESHTSTFIFNPNDEEMLDDVLINGKDPYDVYRDYVNEECTESGLEALVAFIIKSETQLDFGLWKEDPKEIYDNGIGTEPHTYILLPDEDLWIDNVACDTAINIAFKYACELGLTEYGTCYYRGRESHDRNSVYRIVKDEDNNKYISEKLNWKEAMERYPANDNPNMETVSELSCIEDMINNIKDNTSVHDQKYMVLSDISRKLDSLKNKFSK